MISISVQHLSGEKYNCQNNNCNSIYTHIHTYTHTHTHIHTHHTPFLKHTPPFLETVHGAAHTYMHIRTVMVVSSVILCVTHCSMERLGEVQNGDTVNMQFIHGTL